MRLKTALLLLLSVVIVSPVLAILIVRWHMMASPAPKPDFADFGRYLTALNLSHDPVAARIRRQIADGPAALARERAMAQAEGLDMDPAHLQPPMPPADRNAAPLYDCWDTLRKASKMHFPMYADPLGYGYTYTPAQLAGVQAILDAHKDAMALLHQAADRPKCVYQDDWLHINTNDRPITRGEDQREAVRELCTESFLLAEQGHFAEAVTDQTRGFRVDEHAASAPTLMGYLTGNAVEEVTLAGMESILNIAGPDPIVTARVRQTIAMHRSRMLLKPHLAGDATLSPEYMESLRAISPSQLAAFFSSSSGYGVSPSLDPSARFSAGERLFVNHLVDAIEADDLHRWREMIAVADAPRAVRLQFETQSALEAAAAKADPAHRLSPVSLVTDRNPLDFTFLTAIDDRLKAEEQALMAAAEAMETKGRTGTYPAHLAGRYPDPFADGKTLQYRREGANGFAVYSVGPTRKFRGILPKGRRRDLSEVVFRYPGPPLKPVPASLLK